MEAWICDSPIGTNALRWDSLPTPVPGPGQLLVRVSAASLNFPDILIVEGKYQFKPTPPFVPGSELAGIVTTIGRGADGFAVGDRVAATSTTGGFATHASVEASQSWKIPTAMPFHDAAALTLTYGTAHHALLDRAALQPGETVLILGAAGGVGTAAIQIAKAVGARVIAAVSSDEKAAFCRSLGADAAINYGSGNLRDTIKALTNGLGPDVIYDPVGGALAEPAFRSIGWRGRYLVIGFASGTIPSLPFNLALLKGASITGVFWGDFARREPAAHAKAMDQLADWYLKGQIKPWLDEVLPMSRLPEAYARMAARLTNGKTVLTNP